MGNNMATQLPVQIAGAGFYLPEQRVSTAELGLQWGVDAEQMARTTGVIERRYAQYETTAGMGAAAARMALEQAKIDVSQLDAIIGASAAPQQCIPCTAAFVQRELGAPEGRSACFDINATCLSFLFALQTAALQISYGIYDHVLVYSSEIASVALNPKQWESAALFGDAAAAVVLKRSTGSANIMHMQFATHNSGAEHTQCLGGGSLHHPNKPTTTPEMNMFDMNGIAVFRQAVREMRPFLGRFFEQLGSGPEQFDLVIPHQASRHAIEQVSERLGFDRQQVFVNLPERGNCVAASLPLALAEAIHSGRLKRGNKLMMLGTGAGLTLGALALTY